SYACTSFENHLNKLKWRRTEFIYPYSSNDASFKIKQGIIMFTKVHRFIISRVWYNTYFFLDF
ncbi:hypothetical protein KAX02_08790, partial [candidate division WOR-3 bacterium]|nr:hypothetical protein [candidate division WOR-3 bacterium]